MSSRPTGATVAVDDGHLVDAQAADQRGGLAHRRGAGQVLGVAGHHLGQRAAQRVGPAAAEHQPAEVAVGEHAGEPATGVDDHQRPRASHARGVGGGGGGVEALAHGGGRRHRGEVGPRAAAAEPERLGHRGHHPAQPAAAVEAEEIGGAEAAALGAAHRQGVAEGERGGAAGGGGQAQRRGLGDLADGQRVVGEGGELAAALAGDRHQQHAVVAQPLGQRDQLGGVAGVREQQHRVAGSHAAEAAVGRLHGVQRVRGRAGGGEGGRELGPDQPGLAHARHQQHAAGGGRGDEGPHRGGEGLIGLHAADGVGLGGEHAAGEGERLPPGGVSSVRGFLDGSGFFHGGRPPVLPCPSLCPTTPPPARPHRRPRKPQRPRSPQHFRDPEPPRNPKPTRHRLTASSSTPTPARWTSCSTWSSGTRSTSSTSRWPSWWPSTSTTCAQSR